MTCSPGPARKADFAGLVLILAVVMRVKPRCHTTYFSSVCEGSQSSVHDFHCCVATQRYNSEPFTFNDNRMRSRSLPAGVETGASVED